MTKDEAISAARGAAERRGWLQLWGEPVSARRRFKYIVIGPKEWHVIANANRRGGQILMRVDDASGKVTHAVATPK